MAGATAGSLGAWPQGGQKRGQNWLSAVGGRTLLSPSLATPSVADPGQLGSECLVGTGHCHWPQEKGAMAWAGPKKLGPWPQAGQKRGQNWLADDGGRTLPSRSLMAPSAADSGQLGSGCLFGTGPRPLLPETGASAWVGPKTCGRGHGLGNLGQAWLSRGGGEASPHYCPPTPSAAEQE